MLNFFKKKQQKSNEQLVAELRIIDLNKDISRLLKENGELRKNLEQRREVIDVSMGDPIPTDTDKRRLYVGAVAGLHNEFLRPKFLQMVAKIRENLDKEENTREQDLMLKGASYALWEIIRWGDLMVSEDSSYSSGTNVSSPEDKKKKK